MPDDRTDREAPQLLSDETLVELRRRLLTAIARICPAWLSAQAEDIVQSAMMSIIDSRRTDENIAGLRSLYLKRAAYTAMVDEIRRLRRDRLAPDGDEIVSRAEDPSGKDPEESARLSQLGAAIRMCLAGLASARRIAVTLYLHGHSVPEASRLGKWTPKRTENLVYRGLADLRACLASKGMAPNE